MANPMRLNDRGVFILFLAILIVSLMALVGLVIDGGNLYRTRIRLQRTADSGAIGGLSYRTLFGWRHFNPAGTLGTPGANDHEVEYRAIELAKANLSSMNFDVNRATITATYSSLTDNLVVNVSYDQPLFLMGYIPGQPGCNRTSGGRQSCLINVTATTQLTPANIGMLLDTSGSMACPVVNPPGLSPCACRMTGTCNQDFPLANDQVIEVLEEAVTSFVAYFNPNRDRIGVYPYNIITDPQFFSIHDASNAPRAFGQDAATYSAFQNKIQSLVPVGSTNFCDVLSTAYADIGASTPPIFDKEASFLVLFTDGAPSGATLAVANRTRTLDDLIINQHISNEWLQYIIEWHQGTSSYYGPSPLIFKGSMPFNFYADIPSGSPTMCGSVQSNPASFGQSVSQCLTAFDFAVPGANRIVGTGVPLPGTPNSEFIEQYYHCGIELADQFRTRGTSVFSISLGAIPLADPNDPYQDVLDVNSRKEVFLRRLSLDTYHGSADPTFALRSLTLRAPDPRAGQAVSIGYKEYLGYTAVPASSQQMDLQGAELGTENPEDLDSLFSRVAKTILLRLTK